MKKVIVIGCPGSGKSVFSRRLRDITNLKLYHLDMLYHNEDGSHISKDEFDNLLNKIFKEDNWILDGNYQRTIEARLKECDTAFLLDFPVHVSLDGALSRIGKRNEDLPWIDEKLDEDFKNRIIDFSKDKLPQIYELLDKYKNQVNVIVFKSREEVDNYLNNL